MSHELVQLKRAPDQLSEFIGAQPLLKLLTLVPEQRVVWTPQVKTVINLSKTIHAVTGHRKWILGSTGLTMERLLMLLEEMKRGLINKKSLSLQSARPGGYGQAGSRRPGPSAT